MTPTRKGLYKECETCKFKIQDGKHKYPCQKSHKEIRKASGVKYEKDFTNCVLYISVDSEKLLAKIGQIRETKNISPETTKEELNFYKYKGKTIKLCSGKSCIHRYRCYRHSLYNDAEFKNLKYRKIDTQSCINRDYHKLWLPVLLPYK